MGSELHHKPLVNVRTVGSGGVLGFSLFSDQSKGACKKCECRRFHSPVVRMMVPTVRATDPYSGAIAVDSLGPAQVFQFD